MASHGTGLPLPRCDVRNGLHDRVGRRAALHRGATELNPTAAAKLPDTWFVHTPPGGGYADGPRVILTRVGADVLQIEILAPNDPPARGPSDGFLVGLAAAARARVAVVVGWLLNEQVDELTPAAPPGWSGPDRHAAPRGRLTVPCDGPVPSWGRLCR